MQVYINNIIRGYAEIPDIDWFEINSNHPVVTADISVKKITIPDGLNEESLTIVCQSFEYCFQFEIKTELLRNYSTKLLLGIPVKFTTILEGKKRGPYQNL